MKKKELLKRQTTVLYFRKRIYKFVDVLCVKYGWRRIHFVLNVLCDEKYTFDYEIYYQRLKEISRMPNKQLKEYLLKIEKLNECIEDLKHEN